MLINIPHFKFHMITFLTMRGAASKGLQITNFLIIAHFTGTHLYLSVNALWVNDCYLLPIVINQRIELSIIFLVCVG
jgi:hypothetical protein